MISHAHRGSICLVTNDLDYVVRNSGIGTYFSLTAGLLARHGWRVHILHLGTADDADALAQAPRRLAKLGIGFSALGEFEFPAHLRAPQIHAPWFVTTSARARHALEELHGIHHFDLIEFPDWLGFGFVSVQAKRTAPFLESAKLCVKLHGTSAWQRDGNHRWISRPDELVADYCERYAFEHADVQMSPSRYMLDYVRAADWAVRDNAVVAYPYPEPSLDVPLVRTRPVELVFFGRLEIRKGLDLFVDAVGELASDMPITFLGRDTTLATGEPASEYAHRRLAGRNLRFLTDYNREQALDYLAQGDRLAIIASYTETFGFTVAECAVNGIPFIASRVGGIPEVIGDEILNNQILFAPTARDLTRRIQSYLETSADELHALRENIQSATAPAVRNDQVAEQYGELVNKTATRAVESLPMALRLPAELAATGTDGPIGQLPVVRGPLQKSTSLTLRRTTDDEQLTTETPICPLPSRLPLVTVAVSYYNLPEYLPDTLTALTRQSYSDLEVIVVDDGSTGAIAIRIFEDQQRRYPHFRFVSQSNGGPGTARNRALADANGEFFVTVDADNLPRPEMIQRFVDAMTRVGDCAALTCHLAAFRGIENLQAGRYEFLFIPTGGPLVSACFHNVFGDTNAIFRTADLRTVGGFATNPHTPCEDWETFLKLAQAGYAIDVIPEPLFDYRLRGDNRSLVLTKAFTDYYPFVKRIIDEAFADTSQPELALAWHVVAGLEEQSRHRCRLEGEVHYLRRQLADRQNHERQLDELQMAVAELQRHRSWLRYRAADKCASAARRLPLVFPVGRWMLKTGWRFWKRVNS